MKFVVATLLVSFLAQGMSASVGGPSLVDIIGAKTAGGDCVARTQHMLTQCGEACAAALIAFNEFDDSKPAEAAAAIEAAPAVAEVAPAVAAAVEAAPAVAEVAPAVADVAAAVANASPAAAAAVNKVAEAAAAAAAAAAAEAERRRLEGTITGDMEGLNELSDEAEALLSHAISGISDEELAEIAEDLPLDELLNMVRGARTAVTSQSANQADRINKLTARPVFAKGCEKELIDAAKEMAANYSAVPARAAVIADEGIAIYRACNERPEDEQLKCKLENLIPIAVRAGRLAKEVNDLTPASSKMIKDLNGAIKKCRKGGN